MPNTKLTRTKWKNHFQYGKILYIVIALVAILIADLAYTMTTYHAPNERKVDVMVVLSFADTESLEPIAQEALKDGQAFDETLEELTIQNIAYNPSDNSDYYGSQKFMVMLAAQEGDVYLVPEILMESLLNQQVLLPLEGYVESGALDTGDVDLTKSTFEEPYDEEVGETPTGIKHVYGYSIENWYGLMDYNIDNRGLYACIMSYSKNPDTAAHVLQYLNEQFTAEKPEWVTQQEEAEAAAETEEPVFAEEDYVLQEGDGQ